MVRFTQPETDDNEISSDDDNADNNDTIVTNYNCSRTSNRLVFDREEVIGQMSSSHEYNDIIYYDPPSPKSNNQRTRRTYLRCFLLVLIILMSGKYVPPPPPPHHSWSDFVTRSTEDVTTALKNGTILVWYLISGISFNIYQDASYWSQHILLGKTKHINAPCHISLPQQPRGGSVLTSSPSIIEKYLLKTIVGQDEAIRFIAKALDEWEIPKDHSSNNSEQRPLSILLSGSDGVGKKETAKLLARLLFQNCNATEVPSCDNCVDKNGGILELNGVDFALDENESIEGSEGLPNRLTSKILEHVYSRKGAGAAIILNHVEDVPRSTQMELSYLVKRTNVMFKRDRSQAIRHTNRWITTNEIKSLASTVEDDVEVWLGNTFFIFTTSFFAPQKVFELVRKYRQPFEKLPWYELQKMVKEDAYTSFKGPFVSLVVPFWPLQPADLDVIIQKKIANLSHKYKGKMCQGVEFLDSVRRQFISPEVATYIEYGSTVVFASKGGTYLNAYFTSLEKKLEKLPFTSPEDVVLVDYHENKLLIRLCDRRNGEGTCYNVSDEL